MEQSSSCESLTTSANEQAAKALWLEERRLEHERSSKNRRRSLVAAEADTKPDEPDDASLKKEWLRRRRAEHETALKQRRSSSAVDDSAPLVDASLLEMPTERELYLRQIMSSRCRSASGSGWWRRWSGPAAPLVDPSLLEMPSERELYLRAIAEQRSVSQRERQRMSTDAARRPSLMEDEEPDEEEEEEYPFNDCYAKAEMLSGNFYPSFGYPSFEDQDTSRGDSTTDAPTENGEDSMNELEALEALRLHHGMKLTRSPSGSSSSSSNHQQRAGSPRGRRGSRGMGSTNRVAPFMPPHGEGRDAGGGAERLFDYVPSLPASLDRPRMVAHLQEIEPPGPNVPNLAFQQRGDGEAPIDGLWSPASSPGRVLRLEDITIIKGR